MSELAECCPAVKPTILTDKATKDSFICCPRCGRRCTGRNLELLFKLWNAGGSDKPVNPRDARHHDLMLAIQELQGELRAQKQQLDRIEEMLTTHGGVNAGNLLRKAVLEERLKHVPTVKNVIEQARRGGVDIHLDEPIIAEQPCPKP